MEELNYHLNINRRTFLHRSAIGIGGLALGSLLGQSCDDTSLSGSAPFGVLPVP